MEGGWQAGGGGGGGGDVEAVGRWNRSPVERCQSLEILLIAQIPTSQRATPSAQVKKGIIGINRISTDGAAAGTCSGFVDLGVIGGILVY